MKIGNVVQIRIPERWKDADYYKFNRHAGEIVELHEEGLAVARILDTGGILWPTEWLVEYEENDEPIETVGLNELLKEFK